MKNPYDKLNDESKLIIDRLQIVQFGNVIVDVPTNVPLTDHLQQHAFAKIKCEFPGTPDKPFTYTTRRSHSTLRKKLIKHFGASLTRVRAKYVNEKIKTFFEKALQLTTEAIVKFDFTNLRARVSVRITAKIQRERKENHKKALEMIRTVLKTYGKDVTEEEVVELWRMYQIDSVMNT